MNHVHVPFDLLTSIPKITPLGDTERTVKSDSPSPLEKRWLDGQIAAIGGLPLTEALAILYTGEF
jgi:hypothetical protein